MTPGMLIEFRLAEAGVLRISVSTSLFSTECSLVGKSR